MAGPITKFTSVGVASKPGNNSNGLYAPRLNLTQIQNIPASIKQNGGIWYNESTKNLEAVVNNKVEIVQVGPSGQGDVVGPDSATRGNIATFNDATGKLISDSGVDIAQVPNPLLFLKSSSSLATPNLTVNEIGNLGHIKFTGGHGLIFVDTLMPLEFIENSLAGESQVCSLFTGGLPSSSSSPSALVELQSDSGALLLSRLTTNQRNALSIPMTRDQKAHGMLLFNTDTKTFDGFDGTIWRSIPQLNIDGTLTAEYPASSENLTTRDYVDSLVTEVASAKYIVQTRDYNLQYAQVLGELATGMLKNTTTTGVLNIAIPGVDYYSPGKPTRIIDDSISNFFIGNLAGSPTTNGASNTGVGSRSLASIINGKSNTAVGEKSLSMNASGESNSAFGTNSLASNITGTYNSAFGSEALYNINSSGNSAFGYRALYSNQTGLGNVAFGYQALYSNTDYFNSAFGSGALYSNKTGSNNTALGYNALYNNTDGSNNVSIGYQSSTATTTGYNNVSIGYQSSTTTTTGYNNVSIGAKSLSSNTTGYNNIVLGNLSGASWRTNNYCLFLGHEADSTLDNITNSVAIGYRASVSASNSMVLGGTGSNQLSVGIGITPNAQLQLPTIHSNRKLVLYQTGNNDHQVIGLGTAAAMAPGATIFRFQIDNNSTSSGYTWNAATSNIASNELMRLTAGGFLGIGTNAPNAELQLSQNLSNRKLVLYQTANNDHQIYSLGVNSNIFRFQNHSTASDFVFFAATGPAASSELMRLTGQGLLGIGTAGPHAPLQFGNTISNRKIVLFEGGNNDHQFYGLGVNGGAFRFQVSTNTDNFVFYSAGGADSSNELMRLTGVGTLYARQSYASFYGSGSRTTTTVANTYVVVGWPASANLQLIANNYITLGVSFAWSGGTTYPPGPQELKVYFTASMSGGAAGEVTTFAIFKNGTTLLTTMRAIFVPGAANIIPISLGRTSDVTSSNDYFDVRVNHSVSGRTLNITDFTFNISST